MTRAISRRSSRWALSFADLCLLLVAFFALLQANQASRDETLAGLGTYFGAIEAPQQVNLTADNLFEPGEALLSEKGRIALMAAAQPFVKTKGVIRIQSMGIDAGEYRFDAWDLAAARLGAVARTLVSSGIPQTRLRIAGLAETADDKAPARQTIRITEGLSTSK